MCTESRRIHANSLCIPATLFSIVRPDYIQNDTTICCSEYCFENGCPPTHPLHAIHALLLRYRYLVLVLVGMYSQRHPTSSAQPGFRAVSRQGETRGETRGYPHVPQTPHGLESQRRLSSNAQPGSQSMSRDGEMPRGYPHVPHTPQGLIRPPTSGNDDPFGSTAAGQQRDRSGSSVSTNWLLVSLYSPCLINLDEY